MDILFDPNIAYLVLVLGSTLLLLAIVTPGTGALEAGAFFVLALAGYEVYRLGFNLWALIILVISLVPYIYAIQKPKREWALALALLGVTLGSVFLFSTEGFLPSVNPFLAALMSLVTGGFLWLVVRKAIQAHHSKPLQDLKNLIGQRGEAKTRISDDGSVQVAGELWSARSDKAIPAGSHIRVLDRQGFTLVVEQDDQSAK
jgi:membrane-bound ClpP family serine protease